MGSGFRSPTLVQTDGESIASPLALKHQIQTLFFKDESIRLWHRICLSLASGALQASHSINTYCSLAEGGRF